MALALHAHSYAIFPEAYTADEVLNLIRSAPEETDVLVDIDDTIITPASTTFRRPHSNKIMDVGKFGNISSMEEWRANELAGLGIHFSESEDMISDVPGNPSLLRGIMITGANSKSQTTAFFRTILKNKFWILVDDRIEHLMDMKSYCGQNNIEFLGIHFKGLERLTGEPNSKLAEFQKEYLIKNAKWLEDAEALERINLMK